MIASYITLNLPEWLREDLEKQNSPFMSENAQMEFVIGLSKKNVLNNSGGPFGAAIFDLEDGTLISASVNLVVSEQCSVAHAEVLAIMLAQKRLCTYNLSKRNLRLAASGQPCAMCSGAIHWCGIKDVVFGATTKDIQDVAGFDEGPVYPDWKAQCQKSGISIKGPILRDKAVEVLELYSDNCGTVYNA